MSLILKRQLLHTKFVRPHLRPIMVDRPRLLDALNAGRWQKLTLVSGQPGSGKSTLLSVWLSQIDLPSAWLSLDSADNEPRRFLSYLAQALRQLAPSVPEEAITLLFSRGEIDPQGILRGLILPALNDELLDCVLVIDDVHLLTDPAIKELLKTFIQYKPDGLHLALASRTDPDLGLVTLRAKAQINDIRAADLRFRQDEALHFYNHVMHLELDAQTVANIESFTEGWISACQLTALSLKRSVDRSAVPACLAKESTLVSDYLVEEVLQHLPPSVQEFLLTTSVLHRMCDPLCSALLNAHEFTVTLQSLDKDNLFVYPLDDEGYWYRYHPLFAGFLRGRLEKQTPSRLRELHKTAAEWFAAHDLVEEAIDHAIYAQDQLLLVELLENRSLEMFFTGQLEVLRKGLHGLDKHLLQRHPMLALADAFCVFSLESDMDKLDLCTDRAQTALQNSKDNRYAHLHMTIEMSIAGLRAFSNLRRGNYQQALEIASHYRSLIADDISALAGPLDHTIGSCYFALGEIDRAYPYMLKAEREGFESNNYLIAFTAVSFRAGIHNLKIELQDTVDICTSAIRLAKDKGCGLHPFVGSIHLELGFCYFYLGRYEDALVEIEQGIELHKLLQVSQYLATAYCFLARLKLCMDDTKGASIALHHGFVTAKKFGNPDEMPFVLSFQALFDLHRGDLREARRWADTCSPDEMTNVVLREQVRLVKITVALLSGPSETTLKEIRTALRRNLEQGLLLYAFILRMIEVVALAAMGRDEAAADELAVAMRQAMPEGLRAHFQVWGPETEWAATMRKLSRKIQNRELRAFLVSLVGEPDETDVDENRGPTTVSSSSAPLPLPPTEACTLTERELKVLELVSQGMSNPQIAKTLFVSLSTIKTHIQRIYKKLNVKNRTAALRIAREWRLF